MPAYVYRCPKCLHVEWVMRRVEDRNKRIECCGLPMQRLITAPYMNVWNHERRFPNVTPYGDGTMSFPSRSAYEKHLTDLGLAETSHDAPVERPHGNKVIRKVKL